MCVLTCLNFTRNYTFWTFKSYHVSQITTEIVWCITKFGMYIIGPNSIHKRGAAFNFDIVGVEVCKNITSCCPLIRHYLIPLFLRCAAQTALSCRPFRVMGHTFFSVISQGLWYNYKSSDGNIKHTQTFKICQDQFIHEKPLDHITPTLHELQWQEI